jgi:hypothetical protein
VLQPFAIFVFLVGQIKRPGKDARSIVSGWPVRTKPLARRTLRVRHARSAG